MIRIALYLIAYTFSLATAFAQITSEEVSLNNQGVDLPGTLTFAEEKSPLIIWVHGSGQIDRNGNQSAQNITANYIKQFRDAINKKGIAFFSYDKRTANPKNAQFLKEGVLFKDFVLDAREVIHHFKNDPRFSKIILIGHSQGSLVGMLASKNIDAYISLAGPGESIDKTIIRQLTNQSPEFGEIATAHFKELRETGDIKEVNPNLISIFAKPNLPFFESWIQYDPLNEIKKVTVPMLIVNGTKDIQVSVEDAKVLHNANSKSKLEIIKDMNHVLKQINKDEDNLKSYYSADFPLSTELIDTIVSFIK